MQKNIHPYLKTITVILTDGSTYKHSILSNKLQLKLDSDPKSHVIWNSHSKNINFETKGQIAKFNKRFSKK